MTILYYYSDSNANLSILLRTHKFWKSYINVIIKINYNIWLHHIFPRLKPNQNGFHLPTGASSINVKRRVYVSTPDLQRIENCNLKCSGINSSFSLTENYAFIVRNYQTECTGIAALVSCSFIALRYPALIIHTQN